MLRTPLLSVLACALLSPHLLAELRLPSVLSDHMVVQRDVPVKMWGWASPGAAVTVSAGDREPVEATTDSEGRWELELPAMGASGDPMTVTVSGDGATITLDDVLVGEVWVCSGQSNMEWTVGSSANPDKEAAEACYPEIRQIKMPHAPASAPVDDREASWVVCSPETAANFTAVGYFFAREIHRELGVPVGVLNTSWGGTRIEPWVPAPAFSGSERLTKIGEALALATPGSDAHRERATEFIAGVRNWTGDAEQAVEEGEKLAPPPAFPEALVPMGDRDNPHQQPTTLYNGMVHPLVPFPIKGALWYQGESNHREGDIYAEFMSALIGGWRQAWGVGEFPFYFVQIAPFQYGDEEGEILAEFWEVQAQAAKASPHTAMVVINDIGEAQDIHPKNKQDVGLRLARLALAESYGIDGLGEVRSPEAAAMDASEGALRITFDHVGEGLCSRNGEPLSHFEVMGGEGRRFVEAEATIEGTDTVVVRAPDVPDPVAVRFAWDKLAVPNLTNSAGLPTGAFRLGDVPQPE